jgi:hypothetical protein
MDTSQPPPRPRLQFSLGSAVVAMLVVAGLIFVNLLHFHSAGRLVDCVGIIVGSIWLMWFAVDTPQRFSLISVAFLLLILGVVSLVAVIIDLTHYHVE